MKTILLTILLSTIAFGEPTLKGTITQNKSGVIYLVVQGNEEVKSLRLMTPIDPAIITQLPDKAMWFRMPKDLPQFPAMIFQVNGSDELHKTLEVDLDEVRRQRGKSTKAMVNL